MPGRMEFQFALPKSVSAPRRQNPDAPARILIMADFSGRAHRDPSPSAPSERASRSLVRVDADTLDAVMARLAPALRLPLAGETSGATVAISFASIDDFHPDALYQRLELFQVLRRTRARLLDPASFARAAAELNLGPAPASARSEASPAAEEHDPALLERLLGRPASPAPARFTAPSSDALAGLLQAVVRPHIVNIDPQQKSWVAAVDTATGEQLRAILHHPAFQALEAAWRSVHDFVMAVDSTEICIELLDVTRQELLDDSGAAAGEPPATQLRALLEERGAGMDDGPLWSLLIGDYQFGATAEDVALLGALGTLAARAGGPFLAAALPETLGASSPAALADPTSWPALPEDHQRHWNRLRTSAVAPWLGLVLPRVLLRLPYGSKTDPIESFPFEEMPAGHDPAAYLWGNPAFICARLIAAEFGESGWQEGLGAMTELDDLPGHAYEDSGERVLQPATEILLGERALHALLARGLMPLAGHRQRSVVRLLRFQSLADPPASLAGPWQVVS